MPLPQRAHVHGDHEAQRWMTGHRTWQEGLAAVPRCHGHVASMGRAGCAWHTEEVRGIGHRYGEQTGDS